MVLSFEKAKAWKGVNLRFVTSFARFLKSLVHSCSSLVWSVGILNSNKLWNFKLTFNISTLLLSQMNNQHIDLPSHTREKSKNLKLLSKEQIQTMMTQVQHVEEEYFNLSELETTFNDVTVKKAIYGIGKFFSMLKPWWSTIHSKLRVRFKP